MDKKIMSLLITIILSCVVMVGCFKPEPVESNEPKVLRILANIHNKYFIEKYISYFKFKYNNIELEVIDAYALDQVQIMNLLTGPNPPDVIFLTKTQFHDYVSNGLIMSLDSFIKKDDFDYSGITPSVIDTIKFLGNGSIYALSPTFDTQVLFYNKEIFDRWNTPYPEDRMTWDEIFNLAKQLTYKENEIQSYGLAFESNYHEYRQMEYYLQPINLSIFNADFTSLTVDSPEWEKIWGNFAHLHQLGAISPPISIPKPSSPNTTISYNVLELDHFLNGRAAMAIGGFSKVHNLRQIMDRAHDALQFEWDIVSLPIHPELVDTGGDIELPALMAINAKSHQADLAWEYISFMNGDKMAKVISEQDLFLPVRFQYAKPPPGIKIHLEAFTLLKPARNDLSIDFQRMYPKSSIEHITFLGNQLMIDVINERITVKQALQEYETRGQEFLEDIIQLNK